MDVFPRLVKFELARSLSPSRVSIWLILTGFPVLLVAMARLVLSRSNVLESQEASVVIPTAIFYLVCHVACQLGLLLWATPSIGSEVEGQTWIYLATRPIGKPIILLSKYCTALIWSIASGWAAAILCSLIMIDVVGMKMMLIAMSLVFFSAMAYAAAFTFIGVIVYRRSMVIAVIYSLVIDGFLGTVPATISKLTISYRLRQLFLAGMEIEVPNVTLLTNQFDAPPLVHIATLLVYSIVLLSLAITVLVRRELPMHAEA